MYVQVWNAAIAAGPLPQLIYAKLDIARFSALNTSRGPWALLQQLSTTPSTARAAPAQQAALQALPLQALPAAAVAPAQAAAVPLEAVEKAVRDAAASILGPDAAAG
jgi:hypothetical protein